ncbi:MAG TPA: amidohydrolase family protein, partial [Candidatus Binatus sp.]|nr:amidohydrolase family protein [Candidatus Binatus sp.]
MSRLASVRFSDGELPEVMDVVRLASILFAAGQETTTRLLSAGMRVLCEQPTVAQELRSHPGAIPNFVEECLRLESPIEGDHELHKYGSKIKDHKLRMLPSEIFAHQVFTTYEDEKLGVELIPRIGADNVMWASDYPHGDSTWPHSRKALTESPLALHGPAVLRKVTCENAARVYGF